MSEVLKVKNLKKYYYKKNIEIKSLDNISFSLYKGETLGIVGESGSGKSTLARLITKLENPTSGEIEYKSEDILNFNKLQLKEYRKNLQMIFQDSYSSLNPRSKCFNIIKLPLDNLTNLKEDEKSKRVINMAQTVGLSEEQLNRYPHEFSGGQRQRIGIARALIINPEVIIADEPTSALDVSIQAQILNLLSKIKKEMSLTTIFISHDLAVIEHVSDRVIVMYLGEIVEIADSKKIFSNPLHPYTKKLIKSIPATSPHNRKDNKEEKVGIKNLLNSENGCKFADRCIYAEEICYTNKPELKEYEKGQFASCHLVKK